MCNYSSANNKDNDEPETTNIDQEIAFYEESNQADDFIKYWQNNCEKLPILTAFVKRYCIISATSIYFYGNGKYNRFIYLLLL